MILNYVTHVLGRMGDVTVEGWCQATGVGVGAPDAAEREATPRRPTPTETVTGLRRVGIPTDYSFRINHSSCIAWLYLCDRCSMRSLVVLLRHPVSLGTSCTSTTRAL